MWDQAIGSLPWPTLEAAARRYLATETGRPLLSKFVKFLPHGAAARARGERSDAPTEHQRSREDTFAAILQDCTFDGASLFNPYSPLAEHVDRYLAWRKTGSSNLVPPEWWKGHHLAPGQLLAFLDRFAGVGGLSNERVSIEELRF